MRIVSLSLMSVMFWTGVAVAQTADPRGSAHVAAGDQAVEVRERAVTRQLNAEVYVRDREIEARNAQLEKDHREAVRAATAASAASTAADQAAMAVYSAERADDAARAQRQAEAYDRAMSQWRADVAACEAGDRGRCAPRPN